MDKVGKARRAARINAELAVRVLKPNNGTCPRKAAATAGHRERSSAAGHTSGRIADRDRKLRPVVGTCCGRCRVVGGRRPRNSGAVLLPLVAQGSSARCGDAEGGCLSR